MEETYPLSLALFDFVPNIAYLVGAFFLVRLVLLMRGRRCGRMMMAGALFVFLGGTLKATWKLIIAAGGPSISLLSEQQFVLLAIGFTGTVVSVILLAREGRPPAKGVLLPAMVAWKIPFLLVMTLAQLGSLGILFYLCFRRVMPLAGMLFAVAFVMTLAMAGMSSAEQTITIQWIEEAINSAGQAAFAGGCYLLYRKQASLAPEAAC
jgi:hypothetical protein